MNYYELKSEQNTNELLLETYIHVCLAIVLRARALSGPRRKSTWKRVRHSPIGIQHLNSNTYYYNYIFWKK